MANLWLNNYPTKLIKNRISSSGKEFSSVSFFCDTVGKWANFTVSPKQVRNATKQSGEPILNYSCILLGEPTKERYVTYLTDNGFEKISMTLQDILTQIEQNRTDYRNRQQAEVPHKKRKATKVA